MLACFVTKRRAIAVSLLTESLRWEPNFRPRANFSRPFGGSSVLSSAGTGIGRCHHNISVGLVIQISPVDERVGDLPIVPNSANFIRLQDPVPKVDIFNLSHKALVGIKLAANGILLLSQNDGGVTLDLEIFYDFSR